MDWANLPNFLVFFIALLWDAVDWSSDEDDDTTDDDRYSLYDAADYAEVSTGDDTAETEVFATNSVAWFALGGDDTLTGSAGDDFGAMGDGADAADMGAGDDIVYGENGADTLAGGLGNDLMLGGGDNDLVSGDAGDDAMSGEDGNDTLTGGLGADTIYGEDGDDVLSGYDSAGGSSADLTGSDGADVLSGGAGNDTILMGHGDTATGGDDADHFSFDARFDDDGDAGMTVTDFDPAQDTLQLLYTPSYDSAGAEIAPQIGVAPDEAGENALVTLNGDLVAVIDGQPNLTVDVITLTPSSGSTGAGS